MSNAVNDELHQYAMTMLEGRLAQVSDAQRAFFHKVYPRVTPENVVAAIDLCDRTIRKNIADPSRLSLNGCEQ